MVDGAGLHIRSSHLSNPTVRNVMIGILLSPGPVCNLKVVQGLSRVYNSSVNKTKFISAAKKLEQASFGSLVAALKGEIFVKKVPEEVGNLLQLKENEGLCTFAEYRYRFGLPTPAKVTQKLRDALIEMGAVPALHFKPPPPGSKRNTTMP